MVNVTKQGVAKIVKNGWGRIINVSTANGERGRPGPNYSAVKAAAHGVSMALAQELATKCAMVNTVSPGHIGNEVVKAIRLEVLKKWWQPCLLID